VALYFHENQFTYPLPPGRAQRRRTHHPHQRPLILSAGQRRPHLDVASAAHPGRPHIGNDVVAATLSRSTACGHGACTQHEDKPHAAMLTKSGSRICL
jgi:hypothetical protein